MKTLARFFTRVCERFLPDALVFCLLLTLVGFLCAMALTATPWAELPRYWGEGFWSLNNFAMQMVVVLLTGHMLASAPVVRVAIQRLADIPRKETSALVFVTLVSSFACWLNWGFGLIASALVAVGVGKRFRRLNFGLVAAAAYSGFMVWHVGLSGSIPLKIAGSDETLHKVLPGVSIPLGETIFSGWNLSVLGLLVALLPILTLALREDAAVSLLRAPEGEEEGDGGSMSDGSWRSRLEHARWPMLLVSLLPLFHLVRVAGGQGVFDINAVNLAFLTFNLWAHGTPARLVVAVERSVRHCGGIIIQYPFYAGLSAVLERSGLGDALSSWCVANASAQTFPLLCFWAAGLVNFFIPSGGGQWAVQGPVLVQAGLELGVPPAKVALAIAWGDGWTNMLQPFWLLPLLAMAKLQLKDVMGYCVLYCLGGGVVLSLAFIFS